MSNGMEITRIKIDAFNPKESGVCASFTLTFNNLLCVHKVNVIQGAKGLFISFPNSGIPKESEEGKRYVDLVHPTNQEFRQIIEDKVLDAYNAKLKEMQDEVVDVL